MVQFIVDTPYWWKEFDIQKKLIHPILAYADLVATGDTRNIETARRIYDEQIAQYIRED